MLAMIHVVSKHWYKGEHGPGELIGRPSPLGNPWSHLKHTTAKYLVSSRDEAIDKYKPWLDEQLTRDTPAHREFDRLVDKYLAQGKLVLLCWCAPARCHGDYIKERIEKAANERRNASGTAVDPAAV